jgi:uncharacterized protein DUF4159
MSVARVLQLSDGGLARADIRAGARLTEDLWNTAHRMHQDRARLHHVGTHGYGVLAGLQVTATDPASRFVTIHPGLVLDPLGRLLVITESERDRALRLFNVDIGAAGWVHILLDFRDDLTEEPADATNNYLRVLEYAHCEARREPAGPDQIELARILLSRDTRPVTDAADPLRPGVNEIDYRFRTAAGSSIRGELVIGQVFHARPRERTEWDQHITGLTSLSRQLQADGPYQVRCLPVVRLNGDERECALLYLSGTKTLALTAEQTQQLTAYLAEGGVLLAESCLEGFDEAARNLSTQLKIQLQDIPAAHPLLAAHHVFSAPPEGGAGDQAAKSGGSGVSLGVGPNGKGAMILSTRDYGCGWEGKGGLARGRIRDALEFGVNLAVFAAQTQAQARLERLAPPVTGAVR